MNLSDLDGDALKAIFSYLTTVPNIIALLKINRTLRSRLPSWIVQLDEWIVEPYNSENASRHYIPYSFFEQFRQLQRVNVPVLFRTRRQINSLQQFKQLTRLYALFSNDLAHVHYDQKQDLFLPRPYDFVKDVLKQHPKLHLTVERYYSLDEEKATYDGNNESFKFFKDSFSIQSMPLAENLPIAQLAAENRQIKHLAVNMPEINDEDDDEMIYHLENPIFSGVTSLRTWHIVEADDWIQVIRFAGYASNLTEITALCSDLGMYQTQASYSLDHLLRDPDLLIVDRTVKFLNPVVITDLYICLRFFPQVTELAVFVPDHIDLKRATRILRNNIIKRQIPCRICADETVLIQLREQLQKESKASNLFSYHDTVPLE
jgi:hypothetical protein